MKIDKSRFVMKRRGMEDDYDGDLYYFSDLEEYNINFPFQLYIPDKMNSNPDLVMAIRTPSTSFSETFDEAIELAKNGGFNPAIRVLTYRLGNICLMPVIPRTRGIYSSYLGYNMYNNYFDTAYKLSDNKEINFTREDIDKFRDLHIQVYNMIKIAQDYIKKDLAIDIDDKIIITGYSASAKFAQFFSALHLDVVKAIIAGGTGGNHLLFDDSLSYPLGVKDIPDFDKEKFKRIKQFYYMGDNDYNDSTKFKTNFEQEMVNGELDVVRDVHGNAIIKRNDGIKSYHDEIREGSTVHVPEDIPFDKIDFVLDENGDYQLGYAEDGMYTLEQVIYIVNNLGYNTQIRFDKMKEIYQKEGVNAIFNKYRGDHQTVYDDERLFDDILVFLERDYIN